MSDASSQFVASATSPVTAEEEAELRAKAHEQAEDTEIAQIVRDRDATDTGERMSVDELAVAVTTAGDWKATANKLEYDVAHLHEILRIVYQRMRYEDYLETIHWQARREQALQDAGYRCALCGSKPDPERRMHVRLEVHHNTYERLGRELAIDLTVLCRNCHALHHGRPR